jgi:pSer/pThr/pTyr-binding forkhead associated (FHA) protein
MDEESAIPLDVPRASSDALAAGSRGVRKTQAFGLMQEARAKLVLIKGDGLDGVSFTLAGNEHLVGRSDAAMILFEEDRFLSPVHANFYYRFGTLMVRDEGSVNGVYIRIKGTVAVHFGDRVLVGEQMLEVQETPESTVPEPIDDGTYFFGSPRRPAYFRVVQILRGGGVGFAYRADSPVTSIGREGNDIDFPDDPFISGRHARLSWKNKQLSLTDLDSKNGTFLRISGEYPLKHGDYVFMGQQLLRVEIV